MWTELRSGTSPGRNAWVTLLITIGVEPREVEYLRDQVDARVVAYPGVPEIYALDGKLFVESANVMGKYLQPSGVIYHGYFEGPAVEQARRAIALSDIPSYPDVRSTILHDDRVHSLLLAQQFDTVEREFELHRGYLPATAYPGDRGQKWPSFEGERVVKWGNRHAGEGKKRVQCFNTIPEPALVEPFVRGRSERILLVGESSWHLTYASLDWRKNVGATVTIEPEVDATLLYRAQAIAKGLRLPVLGVDFITDPVEANSYLLEVNAYPGFEDVPDAAMSFVGDAARWWNRTCRNVK